MRSKSFVLFLLSGLTIFATITLAILWDSIRLERNYIPLTMAASVALGASFGGLMAGFTEKRSSTPLKTWIGIIGNLIILGTFILYSLGM
jgi:hypothetical protein